MPGVYPTREQPYWRYTPILSVIALFWWMTGLGLWIHYTQQAYNNSQDALDILGLSVVSSISVQIMRVYSSLVATSVVFCVFAVCIHGLAIWRGLVEQQQDTSGVIHEMTGTYLVLFNVIIQVAWWIIALWMIVMLAGFGAFSAAIYLGRQALLNTITYLLNQPVYPPIDGYCALSCLNVPSTGLLSFAGAPASVTLCICDPVALGSAFVASDDAHDAVPGMVVGVMFVVSYGVVLLGYLVSMLVRTSMEQDVSDRLTEQGFNKPGARR